ncbi:formate--tetrahydrofolate ligase [Natronospirillum operosum]|uniref:Formate--tetrahydrofolate ligase n=1 Tax=Natronospirillum operosum TaxID=2759953 RepID=A0A4Z0WEZ8_9GAMM|nr:formate--tetrahydrofolate ligase [Natronospirillum operosum]TGG94012.1 formate--tetrahydrofolate ligase [Natronospirillum operosum]
MASFPSDIEIARGADIKPITEVAAGLDIPADALLQYGHYKAKLSEPFLRQTGSRDDGKLILVTAITPTPAGEGKTTTSVGLGDALNRIGKKTITCLREPSLGPCFGVKGGAAGGGYAQVIPMEDINLHFTGDFHAIGSAHNLLAALVDNHIHWGNELNIDPRRIYLRRVVDMNDRALRHIINSLGGVGNGYVREDGFDITVASEVMAIFCLSRSLQELETRLGNIIVAQTRDREPVTAAQLKANSAMTVLLREAFSPNLVQTLENNPAFIHGGPFANIAHGCNSVMATTTALKMADYVVTEAGFGADLGAEKFFNIKCRKAGLHPNAAVVVATARALKMHGGVGKDDLGQENVEAVLQGGENLARHIRNVKTFGVPVVVAINRFHNDTDAELAAIREVAAEQGAEAFVCTHFTDGSAGAEDLARAVAKLADSGASQYAPLYSDELPLWEKIRTIATTLYGAHDIMANQKVRDQIHEFQESGYGHFPICMAKTQYSFSTDPDLKGAPFDHEVPIREVRLSGGAEFLVVVCGDVMTMPGLPRVPSAEHIGLDAEGNIVGLS